MPELRPADPPPREELRASLAARLHLVVPGFRPIAQDLLADTSRIDLFGVTADGWPVLALVGELGEDLTLVARAIAQREWLAPRLSDWRKLAPDLGIRPGATPQAVVLCAEFGAEARAAARVLPDDELRLVIWRYLRNGSDGHLLLDPIRSGSEASAAATTPAAPPRPPATSFRTGLTESDLGLSAEERADFE